MKAYLQSMGSWIIIERPTGLEPPTLATDGSNRADVIEWSQQEAKAQGARQHPVAPQRRDQPQRQEQDVGKRPLGGSSEHLRRQQRHGSF